MLVEIAIFASIFLIIKNWIACINNRKNCRGKMEFSCESLQRYQYMPFEELSVYVVGEFDFILGILDKAKRSVLIKTETAQRVYNLACILWQSQESSSNLTGLLKDDTFDALVKWTFTTPPNGEYAFIKVAIARVLCSMCSIKPDLYDRLLTKVGIVKNTPGSRPAYIFRHVVPHDMEDAGDAEQPSAPIDLESIDLIENMLKSLSLISLSYMPAYKLIHSKFLSVLIDLIIDFIAKDKSQFTETTSNAMPPSALQMLSPSVVFSSLGCPYNSPAPPPVESSHVREFANQPNVTMAGNSANESSKIDTHSFSMILEFFADLCWQNVFRTWMCSERNTILWENVLQYLCIEVPKSQKGIKYMLPSKPSAKSIRRLEESAINFFSKCCCGHFKNQEKFANVFSNVLKQGVAKGTNPPGLSDFTRRVLLEFIASPGAIFVSIETDLPEGVNKIKTNDISLLLPPPAYPTSKQHQLLYLNVDRSCMDILKKVRTNVADREQKAADHNLSNNLNNNSMLHMSWENCPPSTSKQLFNVSPSPSSSKRSSDNTSVPSAKRTKVSDEEQLYKLMFWAPNMYQFINVSQYLSIAEILQIFVPTGDELEVPVLKFLLSRQDPMDGMEGCPEIHYLMPPPAIQKFLDLDGFKYIALNVEKKLPSASSFKRPLTGFQSVKRGRTCALNQISIHTLLAFGQFLRLPEYRNNPDTKLVLQSIIGMGKETQFNSERYSRFFVQDVTKMCNPLMVFPFELLRLTFTRSYAAEVACLDTIYASAIDFVLMYLAVYTHQPEKKDFNANHENRIYMKAIRQSYLSKNESQKKKNSTHLQMHWPQGVGYSSRSETSKESVDFSRIEEEEELVTALLMVLGKYICPHPLLSSFSFKDHKQEICEMKLMRPISSAAVERIRESCLLPVVVSHLKNDSVFDMVKHIPLYKAIMFVLRTMISNVQFAHLILSASDSNDESPGPSHNKQQLIPDLIGKLKTQIEEYLRRTRTNNNLVSLSSIYDDNYTEFEELIFFEDVLNTADVIEIIRFNTAAFESTRTDSTNPSNNENENVIDLTSDLELQDDYMKIMKNLQFDEYEMIIENPMGGNHFSVPYHFQNEALQSMVIIPNRMKRLAMEMSSLSSSLPISHESAIFVRHDESRIDVMKVLITGPAGTPYMNGCFEFDVFCPSDYPSKPVKVNFQTTGKGAVRFNPNLYNCGKVCLSLLNTWSGEQWNPQTSSILQVLVSIQGMILIPEPYFNEPGWESSRGSTHGQRLSKEYNNNLLPHTIKYAMINQINSPSACFRKIIHTHFYLKRNEIKAQVAEWINESKGSAKQILQTMAGTLFADLDKLTLPV